MTLSHYDLVTKSEKLLLEAMVKDDKETILKLCHINIVFTNEVGKTVSGVKYLPLFHADILSFESIKVINSDIHFFDAVAVVNSLEKRSGTYLGLSFSSEYHLTRVWKFEKKWKLIATATMMPC